MVKTLIKGELGQPALALDLATPQTPPQNGKYFGQK